MGYNRVGQSQERSNDFVALGLRVIELVRQHFYDREKADTWAIAYADYAAKAGNAVTFVELTREVLAQLTSSHTHLYTPFDLEYYGLRAIFRESLDICSVEYESIGVDFTPDYFTRCVFSGGPAAQAGLLRGDKILKADGKQFHPVNSFHNRADDQVTLTVQRYADQSKFEVQVTPRKIDPAQEWLDAQLLGTKLIPHHGKEIAYIPLFSCAGEEYKDALHSAIINKFLDAHALILDLRNGWGGCNPDFLSLFTPTPPILTLIDHDGNETRADTCRLDTQWDKPLYVLINGGTRSGKEMIAFAVQSQHLGTLVGQRTAGAVLGGSCYQLSDTFLLYLAVTSVLLDGERLEGRGILPHVEVPDTLPFASGSDHQLEKALEMAAG